ncbi:MAG: hypothetical protein OKBPIBMD_00407 [Chlorobi bacterium]|nr:hypothetical protein [Chlorobiota bacterium]
MWNSFSSWSGTRTCISSVGTVAARSKPGSKAAYTIDGELDVPTRPNVPRLTGVVSAKAKFSRWQLAQLTSLPSDRRVELNNSFPSASRSGVGSLSGGCRRVGIVITGKYCIGSSGCVNGAQAEINKKSDIPPAVRTALFHLDDSSTCHSPAGCVQGYIVHTTGQHCYWNSCSARIWLVYMHYTCNVSDNECDFVRTDVPA